jgi:hypothetical protein
MPLLEAFGSFHVESTQKSAKFYLMRSYFRLTIKSMLASWKGEEGEWKIHRVILRTDIK